MNPYGLTASITAAANTLACRMSDDEIALLSAVLVQLGDTLATIIARKEMCEKYGGGSAENDAKNEITPAP